MNEINLTLGSTITFYFLIQIFLAAFLVILSIMVLNDIIFEEESGMSFKRFFCFLDSLLILQVITVYFNMFISLGIENLAHLTIIYILLCLLIPITEILDYTREKGKYEKTKLERYIFIAPSIICILLSAGNWLFNI